jgi:hypothetical protein
MFTGTITNSTQLVYKVSKVLKSYTVFELDYSIPAKGILTPLIRIEKYRGYSNAKDVEYYLRTKDNSNWNKCKYITGLKSTQSKNIYYGDHFDNGNKSLMIFEFSEDQSTLIIHYFIGHYPRINHNSLELFKGKILEYYQIIKGSIF